MREDKMKKQRIQELRKIRKRDNNRNVLVHENRNKAVRKYQIKNLPHPFKNKEQYDYLMS